MARCCLTACALAAPLGAQEENGSQHANGDAKPAANGHAKGADAPVTIGRTLRSGKVVAAN